MKNVYQINILAEDIWHKDEALVHTFRFHDAEHDLSFGGRMHIITVELSKAENLAREKPVPEMNAAETWAVFLRYHRDKEKRSLINEILGEKEDIAMAGETAQAFSKEELKYFHEMSKLKYELDMQDRTARMKREAREAREEALEEARKEVRAEVRKEVREEEKQETARRLKTMGLSAAQIAEATGLAPEEMEKL